jgi:hypothetical protein
MFYYFVSRQRCRRRQVDETADEEREGQGRLGAAAGRHQQELGRGQGGLQQTRQFKGKVDGKDFSKTHSDEVGFCTWKRKHNEWC